MITPSAWHPIFPANFDRRRSRGLYNARLDENGPFLTLAGPGLRDSFASPAPYSTWREMVLKKKEVIPPPSISSPASLVRSPRETRLQQLEADFDAANDSTNSSAALRHFFHTACSRLQRRHEVNLPRNTWEHVWTKESASAEVALRKSRRAHHPHGGFGSAASGKHNRPSRRNGLNNGPSNSETKPSRASDDWPDIRVLLQHAPGQK